MTPGVQLRCVGGPVAGRIFALSGDEVIVGWGASGIDVPDSAMAVTQFRLFLRGDRWEIVDLMGWQSTFLNGQVLVQPEPLNFGDQINAGQSTFVFEPVQAQAPSPQQVAMGGQFGQGAPGNPNTQWNQMQSQGQVGPYGPDPYAAPDPFPLFRQFPSRRFWGIGGPLSYRNTPWWRGDNLGEGYSLISFLVFGVVGVFLVWKWPTLWMYLIPPWCVIIGIVTWICGSRMGSRYLGYDGWEYKVYAAKVVRWTGISFVALGIVMAMTAVTHPIHGTKQNTPYRSSQ